MPDPTCQHFAPETQVTLAGQTYTVVEARDERKWLLLEAADGQRRWVARPGASEQLPDPEEPR